MKSDRLYEFFCRNVKETYNQTEQGQDFEMMELKHKFEEELYA